MFSTEDLLKQAERNRSNPTSTVPSAASVVRNSPHNMADFDGLLARAQANQGSEEEDKGFFDHVKGAVGGAVTTALDVIDTPRAAVVSTVKESVDALQGEGFSFDDWWDQSKNNYGFGDLIEEETDIDNIWVKRGLGFTGDVLLDPLSFVSGAAKVGQLGRKGLAGRAFDLGNDDLGQRLLRGGASAASADDLKFLSGSNDAVKAVEGLEKGVFLNVPFSKRLSATPGPAQVKIANFGSGTLLYDKLSGAARTSRVAPSITAVLGGKHTKAKAALINGSAEEAGQAFKTIRSAAVQSGRLQPFIQDAERQAAQLIEQVKDGDSDKLVQQALGGNEQAIASLGKQFGEEFFPQFRKFADGLVTEGNSHVRGANDAAPDVFFGRENWQPTALSDEFADWLDSSSRAGKGNGRLKEGFERKAGLVPGENFLGTELLDPKKHVDGLDVRSQVRKIIGEQQAEFGGEHLNQLFDERFSTSIVAHLKSYGNAVRKRSIEQDLVKQGVAEPLFETIADALPFEEALSLSRADIQVDNFLVQARRASIEADAATEAATRDFTNELQPSLENLNDLSDELDVLRGKRYRLNRDDLDVGSRRQVAGVQRKIDAALVRHTEIEAQLLGEGVEIPSRLPGGASEAQPVGGLFRQTGIGYVLDEGGSYSAKFDNVVSMDSADVLDDKLKDQLAGAGVDAVHTPQGYVPISSEQIDFVKGDVAPGFQQPVHKHLGEIRSRVGALRSELSGEVRVIGFNPDAQTASKSAADASRAVNAEKLAESADVAGDQLETALRSRAERVFAAADRLGEGAEGDTARLSGQADVAAAELGESTLDSSTMLKALKRRDFQDSLAYNMKDGFRKLSDTTQAPDLVAETIEGGAKLFEENGSKLLEYWDTANRAFKTHAILTPGFHSRNFMGGVFNNFLAGVDNGTAKTAIKLDSAYKRSLKSHGDSVRARQQLVDKYGDDGEAYALAVEYGAIGGGQTSEVSVAFADGGKRKQNVTKRPQGFVDNSVTRGPLGRQGGEKVEDSLRSALFIDRIRKGATPADALADVHKFHFDYDDLSAFESQVARRVVPFYTWSRKNLPLQIEGLLTNPKAYNRFQHVKRNIELGVEEEETVPGYVEEGLHIRLPFELPGGRTYLIPELPFRELTRTLDPGQIFGSTTPLVKTPLELKFGKKSFQNIPFRLDPQEVPAAWAGVGQAMDALGLAENIDGKFYAKDQDLYTIEQALPLLARVRRAAPSDSDEAFKDRQTTTLVNYFLGLGLFTNTERSQNNELYRREIESRDETRYQSALAELSQ